MPGMARIARVVIPDVPHHVVQRGNRRQDVFFREEDYARYIDLMAEWCGRCGVSIWAYCLMTNHVHLIATPSDEEGLARAVGEAHRRYTRAINAREEWTGYLWQGRFSSYPMDERHLLAAARYVEHNPVAAGLVGRPQDYRWSSARAHLAGQDDKLVSVTPLLQRMPDWRTFIDDRPSKDDVDRVERHSATGRPCGGVGFIAEAEARLGRTLAPAKRGPKSVGVSVQGKAGD